MVRISALDHSGTTDCKSKVLDLINNTLQVPITNDEIDDAFPISRRKNAPIIIKFPRTKMKQNIIKGRSKLKTLPTKLYINENLTKRRVTAYKEARKLVKEKKINST